MAKEIHMSGFPTTMRWLIGSAVGAIVAAFLIGLFGMLTKVLFTGNGVAYFASVAGAFLAILVAGPGCWLTLAIIFRITAKRNVASAQPVTYKRVGVLWGIAHSAVAICLCGLQMIAPLASAAYGLSLLTGTAVTSAMIYLPPAWDHLIILLVPAFAGWLAGALFSRIAVRRRRDQSLDGSLSKEAPQVTV
jgi:hypothetical protein